MHPSAMNLVAQAEVPNCLPAINSLLEEASYGWAQVTALQQLHNNDKDGIESKVSQKVQS